MSQENLKLKRAVRKNRTQSTGATIRPVQNILKLLFNFS